MTRRERLEARAARRSEWADKAKAEAARRFDGVRKIVDNIPLGQPILVGHHSERHARRDADRIDNGMRAGFEAEKRASHHTSRAGGIEHQLERSVFTDDHDAIEALEARIAERMVLIERQTAINKLWRKSGPEAVVAAGLMGPKTAAEIAHQMATYSWVKSPCDLTSDRAAVRRDKARIEEVRARNEKMKRVEAAGGVLVTQSNDGSQTHITFENYPGRATVEALKAGGFWFSGGTWHGPTSTLPSSIKV